MKGTTITIRITINCITSTSIRNIVEYDIQNYIFIMDCKNLRTSHKNILMILLDNTLYCIEVETVLKCMFYLNRIN